MSTAVHRARALAGSALIEAAEPSTRNRSVPWPGPSHLSRHPRQQTRGQLDGDSWDRPAQAGPRRSGRVDSDGRRISRPLTVKNDVALISVLLKWIRSIADGTPVTWAIKDGRGFARGLADGLLLAGHEVIWVPTRLMAAHRKLHAATGSKSDPVDAPAVAHPAWTAIASTSACASHSHRPATVPPWRPRPPGPAHTHEGRPRSSTRTQTPPDRRHPSRDGPRPGLLATPHRTAPARRLT
ncbi:transposase [Streptomyces sp. NPDC088748]|uniref:IS110 family transposase n=1 Tax=Streptomyces sp. NPDC088748 TaxID=3365887 RepID=UPI0038235407